MAKITVELILKKSEHNEGEINTLKELSLHQESIEKIEHIQDWCRDLEILLLQGNLIARIENLNKLKRLRYLNLAVNNIEVIDNLERCEALQKLDLTLNFIGNIESVCSLQNNIHLNELYLTGNPCTEFTGYRHYIINKLPQLTSLDGCEIVRSERLKVAQIGDDVDGQVRVEQEKYMIRRSEQRVRLAGLQPNNVSNEEFWRQESEHCPEVRLDMARRCRREKFEQEDDTSTLKEPLSLSSKDGRPLNINQAKLKFNLISDTDFLELHVEIYKYLDSALLQVDLHPMFVTIAIKNKIFQLVFPEEVNIDDSFARRSTTTGHLVLRMKKTKQTCLTKADDSIIKKVKEEVTAPLQRKQRREFLEIGSEDLPALFNVTQNVKDQIECLDDSEVPPLE